MAVDSLRLSSRLLWRNWRSGELKILALALALAVAVVTAIAVFASRMDQSLQRQSNTYLAADRVVASRFDVPIEWRSQPEQWQLQQSTTAEFSSMVFAGGEMHLASVKAVAEGYPLRGRLEVSDKAFAVGEDVQAAVGIPAPGEVWVDSRLLPLMNLALGDQLSIGNKTFNLNQVVIREPDGVNGFSAFGPRVLMNMADLDATGVIQPGSRVNWRWLLAGEEPALKGFENWLEPQLGDHYRLQTIKNAQRNIGSALDRGTRFLMLAAVIGVLLASVAIAIAAQQFANRHVDQVALMKSLGASAYRVRQLYFSQLLLLGLLASTLGLVIGEIIQRLIANSLASLFSVELLTAAWSAYATGLATGLLCLLCFALPPLWHLPKVSPLKVLRRELVVQGIELWLKGLLGLVAIVLLIWIYSGDSLITLSIVGGFAAVLLSAALIAWLLLHSSQRLGSRAGSYWRLALSSLQRYRTQSITQILVFACALMLLMVLYSVRTSLIDEWRLQLPEDAPNHFLLNIAPYEQQQVETLLGQNQLSPSPFYPMVMGRLTGLNDIAFTEADRQRSNALRRELNLSWAEQMAADNKLVDGQWWDSWQGSTGLPGVSIEAEEAEEIGIAVGDVISFSLGGLELKAEVASVRTVDWNAMTPNFYFLFAPGALDGFSANFLTSVYIPPGQKTLVNTVLKNYPTIVVLEVDRIIERVSAIVEQVSRGIELVLWLVLFGGVMVLVAAVNASMSSRMQETGLLRALGSGRKLILSSLALEFATLGLLAGAIAVLGSESLLLGLQALVFEGTIHPHYSLWLAGPVLGALLIGALGLLACRKVVTVPPNSVLREIEG